MIDKEVVRAINIDRKNKKGSFLKKFLIFLGIAIVGLVALGFLFPGLFWAKDLGVKYTMDDYNSIINKLNYKTNNIISGEYDVNYGPVKNVDMTFTSEELTAFVNENNPGVNKLKNFQLRINNDGTIEIVCNINIDYLLNDLLDSKYSKEKIENEIPAIGILPDNVNLYIHFSGTVVNNKLDLNIETISIQGMRIPYSFISDNKVRYEIESSVNNRISEFNIETGSNFNRISIDNSQIRIQGAIPSSIERIKK